MTLERIIRSFISMPVSIAIMAMGCCSLAITIYMPASASKLVQTIIIAFLGLNLFICLSYNAKKIIKRSTLVGLGTISLHLGTLLLLIALGLNQFHEASYVEMRTGDTIDLSSYGIKGNLRLLETGVDYYPGGEIKQYTSRITFSADNKNQQALIYVNHPANYLGLKVYQASFRSDPQDTICGLKIKKAGPAPLLLTGALLLVCGAVSVPLRRLKNGT